MKMILVTDKPELSYTVCDVLSCSVSMNDWDQPKFEVTASGRNGWHKITQKPGIDISYDDFVELLEGERELF